jgi:hypothetical protein
MRSDRKALQVVLLGAVVCCFLTGASPALTPRVTKAASARGDVASDCNESLAPPSTPRVVVAEIPLARPASMDLTPPPSGDLRASLRDAQDALRRNDRPLFDTSLTRARRLLAAWPPGAERRAAEELVRIYDDAANVWNLQFESPFFDETSPVYQRLNGYPGWRDAVRRSMLRDDEEHTFYPAGESRTFLATLAAERLRTLGIRAQAPPPPRVAVQRPAEPHPSTHAASIARQPEVKSSSSSRTQTTSRQSTTRKSSTTASTHTRHSSQPSGGTSRSVERSQKSTSTSPKSASTSHTASRAETPSRTTAAAPTQEAKASPPPVQSEARPAATKPPASAPPPATTTPLAGANTAPNGVPAASAPATSSPVDSGASSTAATDFGATDSAATDSISTDTAASDSAAIGIVSTDAATTDTALTAADTPVAPSRTRSVVLPVILILIGLGVLVMLFRAS